MLEIRRLTKQFAGKTVADNLAFTLPSGKILAVLGASGCGKTTLLNMIAGLVAPDSGSVCLNGTDITRLPPEKRHISLMFQQYALLPHLNVWQNAALGLRFGGTPKAAARARAQEVLAEVGLADAAERHIDSLSGGEQQRVALARALAVRPRLILLDEPFSNLDTGLRHTLRELTCNQIRRQNIPAVLVTHDPEEALLAADEIALMRNGVIAQYGTPETLRNRPADAWAAQLLGCTNVSENHYLPPYAVRPDPNGIPCTIQAAHPLPDGVRIRIRHPQYGILETTLAESRVPAGDTINIAVDENAIIRFA